MHLYYYDLTTAHLKSRIYQPINYCKSRTQFSTKLDFVSPKIT